MSPFALASLGDIINLRGLFLAVPLVAIVLLIAWLLSRSKKKRRARPGRFLEYRVPGRPAAQCRTLLATPHADDLLETELKNAASGGWYLHFTLHKPTAQPLDTLYLLQFEDGPDAHFTLQFVREAFGNPDPILPESLLDAFFLQKLGAQRVQPTPEPPPPAA